MTADELWLYVDAWRQAELDGMAKESEQSAGSTYLRERLQVIAARVCQEYTGDLVEIGCLNGSTSVLLAKVARAFGRRLICVDPWEIGTQNCDGGEFERFTEAIKPYSDIVDVVRKDSRDPEAIAYVKARPLAFAFVDGLHTHDACLSDIRTCYHANLVAVDDWTWHEGIRQAIAEGKGNRTVIMHKPYHEAFIL